MFRDGSWWVCSFFIGVFCYMFGTLSSFPIWSETDTKLSVFANLTTSIASIATLAAAFYAYKSFSSWESRLKKQHRFEQKSTILKELSSSFELVMHQLQVTIISKIEQKENNEEVKVQFITFHCALADYKSKFNNLQSIKKNQEIYAISPEKIESLLREFLSDKNPAPDKKARIKATDFHKSGTNILVSLLSELYKEDRLK